VGGLKTNRKIEVQGRTMRAGEFAATIPGESRKELRHGDDRQWSFTTSVRLPGVLHRVRIVILWNNRRDETPTKILVTKRTRWEVQRNLRVYRQRWTGTETLHSDGKQLLGMGDCQLRHGRGQTPHRYLVMLAYSLLMRALHTANAKAWAFARLTTIGQACRAAIAETLRATLQWAVENTVGKSQPLKHVLAQLALT